MSSNMYGHSRPLVDTDYLRIGKDLIRPFDPKRVQPASYDVTLSERILRPKTYTEFNVYSEPPHVDLARVNPAEMMFEDEIGEEGYILEPQRSILGATLEHISCPTDMICSVDGKSTIGRCFIAIHSTAGFVDPGFSGVVTLEITNHGPWSFLLRKHMPIGQLRFTWLGMCVSQGYGSPGLGSHYQNSGDVRAAAGPNARRS